MMYGRVVFHNSISNTCAALPAAPLLRRITEGRGLSQAASSALRFLYFHGETGLANQPRRQDRIRGMSFPSYDGTLPLSLHVTLFHGGNRHEIPYTGLGVALLDERAVAEGIAHFVKGDGAGDAFIRKGRKNLQDFGRIGAARGL